MFTSSWVHSEQASSANTMPDGVALMVFGSHPPKSLKSQEWPSFLHNHHRRWKNSLVSNKFLLRCFFIVLFLRKERRKLTPRAENEKEVIPEAFPFLISTMLCTVHCAVCGWASPINFCRGDEKFGYIFGCFIFTFPPLVPSDLRAAPKQFLEFITCSRLSSRLRHIWRALISILIERCRHVCWQLSLGCRHVTGARWI